MSDVVCGCGWPKMACIIRASGNYPEDNLHLTCAERDATLDSGSLGSESGATRERRLSRAAYAPTAPAVQVRPATPEESR